MAKEIDEQGEEIVRQYVAKLRESGLTVDEAWLFGSRVRGNARRWSDVDICVVTPDLPEEGVGDIWDKMLVVAASLEAPLPIEPVPMKREDLDNPYSTLAAEIRRYGRKVV